jgi:hypothetical protein
MRNLLEEFDNTYDLGIQDERNRILYELDRLEAQSHATRTPIYQNKVFDILRSIINKTNTHPPTNFRDKSNGE